MTKTIKFLRFTVFSCYTEEGFGWFRIIGKGLYWKDTTKHQLMFSQRNGYHKSVKLGKWYFQILK